MLKSWHRTAGLFAAVFLLSLTVSGLLLMHTDRLELDSRFIGNELVLDWYGIRPAPPPFSVAVKDHWVSQIGQHIYFDRNHLVSASGPLAGAVATGSVTIVVLRDLLLVVDAAGAIVEQLDAVAGLPPDLEHVGLDRENRVVVQGANARFVFDPETASFTPTGTAQSVRWSEAGEPPHKLAQSIERDYRGNGLSLERVLLDLHSGRLFGHAGVFLINAASVLTLILIISGAILWFGRKRGETRNGSQ